MEYEVWWPVHVRAAKGEILTPEESEILKDAYAEQDRDERDQLDPGYLIDIEALQKLKEEVSSLQYASSLAKRKDDGFSLRFDDSLKLSILTQKTRSDSRPCRDFRR